MTAPDSAGVIVTRRGDATWITLNRPERRNAYDPVMAETISAAIDDASRSRAVVITGSGGSFCAGGALSGLAEPDVTGMRGLYRGSLRMFDAVRSCPRPVIAAVNGAAAGGGNELVVACDLAIAAESATFGQTGPRVGSAPVTGATNVMGVQIGEKRAKEMAMLCRRYSATEALGLGLVNAVVPDAELTATVEAWIAELARLSPRYLEITKISSNVWWNAARDSFATGLGMLVQAIGSADMTEGARAFLDKRPPRFPGPDEPGGPDVRVVVVGASLAGVRTVQALRRRGCDARVTLVGAEPAIACDRPPLSKSFLAAADRDAPAAPVIAPDRLAALDVALRLGTAAVALDPRERTVVLDDGDRLPYDALVVTTGSAPRVLPGLPPGSDVHVLRTEHDAAAVRAGCAPGAKVVVVGGGFIGAEVAWTARGLGCEVTVVEPARALMPRGLGPVLGAALTRRHVRAGVRVLLGAEVTGVESGRSGVEAVRLRDGRTLPADLVVVGAGSVPQTRWLTGSGLPLDDGVVCDDRLRAAGLPDVYAAGDVARWHHPRYRALVRCEHWTNAVEQADVVAANLTGEDLPYTAVPYVWSDQLGTRLHIHGRVGPHDWVRVVHGDPGDGAFVAVTGRGEELRAVVALGAARAHAPYRDLLLTGGDWEQARTLAEGCS
ncbi:FAD-dependent oxidoreductase [Streptomyces spongiae]|uniref:Uncharacterized protein n=1 Tax=Streptomyces spongiae TaxID=565072 RepID=A0A5N8XD97_9ACTN|nr:FAD-dependent oxidoreductase [Streptomyces spongiae]MPY56505.1 hypothetical protein [Streptomyces spongiae]